MRRAYKKLENEPLPPFAENLVFWAPLTEGDLTDHISGVSPTTDAGCSVTWDANKGMYKLRCYSSSNYSYVAALHYVVGEIIDLNTLNRDGFTITLFMQEISYSGNHYSAYASANGLKEVFGSGSVANDNAYMYVCGARFSGTTVKQDNRITVVCNNQVIRYYYNGVLSLESGWSFINDKSGIYSISVCQKHSNNTEMTIFAKDVRIYNRALTASEVAQL